MFALEDERFSDDEESESEGESGRLTKGGK